MAKPPIRQAALGVLGAPLPTVAGKSPDRGAAIDRGPIEPEPFRNGAFDENATVGARRRQ
jgi:hypothetical protein